MKQFITAATAYVYWRIIMEAVGIVLMVAVMAGLWMMLKATGDIFGLS